MKRKLSLFVMLLLALLFVFTACSQTEVTNKLCRWDNGTLTYNISLADFSTNVSRGDGTFYKDVLYSTETNPSSDSMDSIVPDALTGTYVVTIEKQTGNLCKVTTMQVVEATYPTDHVQQLLEVATADIIVSSNDEQTTLRSTTETSVVFKNEPEQTPVSSSTKVKGFYAGKNHQEVSSYEISTQYESYKKGLIAKVTQDGQTTEHKIEGTSIIDANQILTYLRSFDKTDVSFQDSPSVLAFDPLYKTTQTLNFAYVYQQNVIVDVENSICAKLSNVTVFIGGIPFMSQQNLPDLSSKNLDTASKGEETVPAYTSFRFRVGYMSYQLANVEQAIVDAITVTPEN